MPWDDSDSALFAAACAIVRTKYDADYSQRMIGEWESLRSELKQLGSHLTTGAIEEYSIRHYGSITISDLSPHLPSRIKQAIRFLRILFSYVANGYIENRDPAFVRKLITNYAHQNFLPLVSEFLAYRKSQRLSDKTIKIDEENLYKFCKYIGTRIRMFKDISPELIYQYFDSERSCSVKISVKTTLSKYFQFLYEVKYFQRNYALALPSLKRPEPKIQKVYTREELVQVLKTINLNALGGKRDFAMFLLLVNYGLRASDIAQLKFENIDWDHDKISLVQKKTGKPLVLDLSASVGNAILNYIKYERPEVDHQYIFVQLSNKTLGKPLTSTNLYAIISRCIDKSLVNTENKKKGPHAIRYSLASLLLKLNTSIQTISSILGHSTIETTNKYVKVDFSQLELCCLEMPPIKSKFLR